MTTKLKMGSGENFWDKLTLIVSGTITQIIRLADRDTAIDINRQLSITYFDDHTGDLDVEIDGKTYKWSDTQWRDVLGVTEQWLQEYVAIEQEDIFK